MARKTIVSHMIHNNYVHIHPNVTVGGVADNSPREMDASKGAQ